MDITQPPEGLGEDDESGVDSGIETRRPSQGARVPARRRAAAVVAVASVLSGGGVLLALWYLRRGTDEAPSDPAGVVASPQPEAVPALDGGAADVEGGFGSAGTEDAAARVAPEAPPERAKRRAAPPPSARGPDGGATPLEEPVVDEDPPSPRGLPLAREVPY